MYNPAAVAISGGICPSGWHVSSESDWLQVLTAVSTTWASSGSANKLFSAASGGTNAASIGLTKGGYTSTSVGEGMSWLNVESGWWFTGATGYSVTFSGAIYKVNGPNADFGRYIRCVKD
jgi:uncharacterized protein (TIGR02145 family)